MEEGLPFSQRWIIRILEAADNFCIYICECFVATHSDNVKEKNIAMKSVHRLFEKRVKPPTRIEPAWRITT